ncbi:MAG: DUF2842 domain-containing protein [Devosia sp.]
MRRKTRSLLGTVAIIVLMIAYPVAIVVLVGDQMARLPWWGSIPIFALLGLLWFVPAAVVVRWMSRPDA